MHFKIVVAGPKGTGKTCITNMLSGTSGAEKLLVENYEPTEGVRILEFEVRAHGISEDCNIELWDASGDSQYEGCWKAVMAEADGVLLVYNPDSPSQDREIVDWFDIFVRKNGLKDEQCLLIAHKQPGASEKFKPPALFSKVAAMLSNPGKAAEIKAKFESLIKDLYYIKIKK